MKRELEEYLQMLEAEKMMYDQSGIPYPEELEEQMKEWGIFRPEEEYEIVEIKNAEDIDKIPF